MLPFRTWPRARLTCQADFSLDRVLNIDFADTAAGTIPFHLSLRGAEGVLVVNRRHAPGWRRELRWPLVPRGGPVSVRVEFQGGRVALLLDDALIGRFDALPRPDRHGRLGLRHGFPGLRGIDRVGWHGALVPGSLHLLYPGGEAPPAGWRLTDGLEVQWNPGPGQTLAQAVPLTVTGLEAPLQAIPRALPELGPDGRQPRVLAAALPGRVWLSGAARIELALPGAPPLHLTRADLIARLGRAAAADLWQGDKVAALLAVEHARHAGVLADLSADARAALIAAARRLAVDRWLLDGVALPPPPAAPPVPAAPPDAGAAMAALLAAGDRDAARDLVAQALADAALPRAARQLLARQAVEGFAHAGMLDDLVALTASAGLLPLDEGDNAWMVSTALPFDLVQGWFGSVANRLRWLAGGARGWAITPALGWTMARLVRPVSGPDDPAPPSAPDMAQVAAAVAAFADYLDMLARDPVGRGPCTALMAGARAVLTHPDAPIPDAERARLAWAAIRLWGLAPQFWDGFGGAVPDMLRAPADLCAEIRDLTLAQHLNPARLDAALMAASVMGMVEAARFRRELLAPSGLPDWRPDAAACLRRGMDADEASLRALLHPDGSDTDDPLTLQAAARGLRRFWAGVPSAGAGGAERALLAQARRLIAEPHPTALQDWGRAALALSGPQVQGVGAALALGTAAALARGGGPERAEAVLAPLLAAPPPPDTTEGPGLALAVLARHHPDLAGRAAAALGRPAPAPGRPDPLALAGDPVFDTLVAVYTCRPYLDSRLPHLRATWLADLDAAGIPWLVFTGAGDGRRDGRIVHLDAPDDYEGLPDKTLALVRWVLDNTAFSRLLKVDDDCHVHVPAMFGDLAPLRHPYLGRALTLAPGQMDRTWHMAKSRGARGRLELDKSPDTARYADGGSGYMLSRGAMAALLAAAEGAEGQRLRQMSFMEDKLVGDLLATQGIAVSGEDWRTGVWRRPVPGAAPRPAWEQGILPFAGAPIRLSHLDDAAACAEAQAAARAPAPRRGLIWPTQTPLRLGNGTNALDMVTGPDRLALARAARVVVVACLRDEAAMVPAFLDHYRRLGVGAFLIADNGSTDGTADLLAQAPDVALFHAATEYRQSLYGVLWQQALLSHFRLGKWSLVADADEFLILPDAVADLPALLAHPDFAEADAARLLMLDLYPRGPLSGVTLASGDPIGETGWADRQPFLRRSAARGPFSDAQTVTSGLRHRLIPGSRPELFVAQKFALLRYRPWMRLSEGLHYVAGVKPAPRDLIFAHLKYTAAFRAKVEAEERRGQHFNDAEEYRRYLAMMAEGREVIWDPDVSIPWREVPEVRALLEG